MDISKISECGKRIEYKTDDVICTEGDAGHTAYMLLKGVARVYVGAVSGNSREMALLKTGTLFGEMSLLENMPRTATVIAASNDVVVLEIGKDDFIELMKTDNEIAYNLLRMLYTRVENSLEKYKGYIIKLRADILNDEKYQIITKLNQKQFADIVSHDANYAVSLLTYLSHALNKIDKKITTL